MAVFHNVLDFLCALSEWVCGVALVFLTGIFGWLVYGRYVLNATPTWVEQASLLLIMLIGFLGASIGVRRHTHLGVSYFRDRCPRPLKRFLELLSYIILGLFGIVMMLNSYQLMMFKWGSQIPLIDLPEGLRALPITLCGGLTALYCLGHILDWFAGVEHGPLIAAD